LGGFWYRLANIEDVLKMVGLPFICGDSPILSILYPIE